MGGTARLILAGVLLSTPVWPPAAAAADPPPPRVEVVAKNPPKRDLELVLPFSIGPRSMGELGVRILKNGEILLEKDGLARLATPALSPAGAALLGAVPAEKGFQSLRRLREAGLDIFYEPQRLEILLRPSAEQAASAELSLSWYRQRAHPPTPTTGVSGFLNLYNALDIDHQTPKGAFGDRAVRTLMDGAVHFGVATLEGEASYDERSGGGMHRSGTRLVADNLDFLVRARAGDLVTQTTGFQTSEDILGVSLSRSFSELDPGISVRPTGAQSFRLNRPSRVDIIVNDAFVRRLNLQPGEYRLQDLGFSAGANNVQLLIEDDAGRRERLDFTLFLSGSLLAAGLTEFELMGGIRSRLENDQRVYSGGEGAGQGIFSGFVRHGFTDSLTLGLDAQADEQSRLFGGEALLATSFGAFSLNLAGSQQRHGQSGYAVDFNYELSRFKLYPGDEANRSLSLSLEHRSDQFSALGDLGIDAANRFASTYNQDLGGGYRLGLSGIWESGVKDTNTGNSTGNRSNLIATLSGWKVKGAQVAVSLGYTNGYTDFEGIYGLLALTIDFDLRHRGSATYDSRYDRLQVDYSKTAPDEIGAVNYDLRASQERGTGSFSGSLRYTANRTELEVEQEVATADGFGLVQTNQTTLRANTALVFAGGYVTLSRPVHDGFALIGLHPTISDKTMVIDPPKGVDLWGAAYSAGPRYQTDFLGPAVVNDLSAYSHRDIAVSVNDLPLGYDLGAGAFSVTPYYKAGYGFTVGSDYSVTLVATVLNREGEPVSLLSGTAVEEGESSHGPIQVFTNRKGRLVAQGLRPGRWTISLTEAQGRLRYVIDIQKGASGIVRLGTLSPATGQ